MLHTIPILLYFTHMLGFMTQKESMNMLLASLDYKRHSKTLFIACKINQNKQINKGNLYSPCYVHQLISFFFLVLKISKKKVNLFTLVHYHLSEFKQAKHWIKIHIQFDIISLILLDHANGQHSMYRYLKLKPMCML